MKSAKRGLRCVLAVAAEGGADYGGVLSPDGGRSVSFVIRFLVGIFRRGFVDYWLADYVFFAGPGAEVEEFATFAAEGKVRVRVGICGLAANWAMEFHGRTRIRLTRMELK